VEVFREQMSFIQDMGGTDIVLAELGHAVHQQPVARIANKPVFNDDQWRAMVGSGKRHSTLAGAEYTLYA
jgi:inosose dehydratase